MGGRNISHVSTVLEQIEPLIATLSDSERLELIRTIAIGRSKLANEVSSEDEFIAQMIAEQNAWYSRPNRDRQQFPKEYVAIYRGDIVDHDLDRLSLLRRVRQRYGNAPIPVLPADQEGVPEYVIHHPQMIL